MKNDEQLETVQGDGTDGLLDQVHPLDAPIDEPWASGQRKRYLASLPRPQR